MLYCYQERLVAVKQETESQTDHCSLPDILSSSMNNRNIVMYAAKILAYLRSRSRFNMATSVEDDDDAHSFPEDLAKEILQGLPVKSLLRFKCISKNWYALISSCSFTSKHFNYHGKNKRPKLFIRDRDPSDDSTAITLISDSDKDKGTPLIEKPVHLQGFGTDILMGGPVDGVFLFVKKNSSTEYDRSLGLWNPATREVTTLPAVHFQLQPFFLEMNGYFGFAFDSFTRNYKVVWVRQFWDRNSYRMFHRGYAAVYSSSTDSWRILKHKHHKVLTISGYVCGIRNMPGYLNGTYYWMIEKFDYCGLISFDFDNEVFGEIKGPDVPLTGCHDMILRDGSINLLVQGFNRDFVLWVMIEPGVWNKLHTFRCLSLIDPLFCGFWDATTIIFLTRSSGLSSYNVTTQETRHLGFRYQGGIFDCRVYYYKESLVTIKRGNREVDRPL